MKEVLENWSETIPPWIWNLIVTLSAVVIGLIIKLIIRAILIFYRNRNDYSLFKSIITNVGRPLNHFVPLLVLNLMLPMMELSKKLYVPVSRAVEIALIISFASLLVSAIKVFEDYTYHVYDLNKADNLKERKIRTQLQFIRRIVVTVIVLITIAVVLLSFDNVRKIGAGLLTGVGIGGIIIGFAAQRSLANFLAGFQIAFTQPIRIDDVLVVEGEWGRVEDITLTYVVLNIWDQRRLILPINYFIEKPFQNWTRVSSELLGTVILYLDYNMQMDKLREEFDRLLGNTPLWDKRVKVIQVTDATEKTIQVRVLVSALNSSHMFDLRCYLRENLIKYIQENHPESLPANRSVLVNASAEVKEIPGAGRV
ncbi:mechanosensitive ion channel family protein [Mucilaginibacter hurinus]|uniref:Mechanosensitive ion channel family protein n=1 Tax=Mucilaginibacter hurinus TaxID=2201324 RepID=A0A367GMV9_9SPHI|nr:mechanosensitive ion channel domain-containing protein [Mucilaginibacter hurinus]RCH54799.1 mechanosensitive ion channel family protein [Mucilaginibacter hurinus]